MPAGVAGADGALHADSSSTRPAAQTALPSARQAQAETLVTRSKPGGIPTELVSVPRLPYGRCGRTRAQLEVLLETSRETRWHPL